MGRIIGMLVGVMLCFGIVQDVRAQGITIDTNEVRILLGVGQSMPQMTDTLTRSANIGAPGASSWDFSKLNTTTATHLISTLPSASTYAADFPAATHAMRDTAFNYSFYSSTLGNVQLKGSGYTYYAFANNTLDNAGFKGSGSAYINGSPYPARGAWLNSPAATELAFPVQMGRTWTSNYTESISGSVFALGTDIPFGPVYNTHAVTFVVDAYGPMDMPDGITRNALRIRKTDHYVNGTDPGTRVGYIFRSRDGAFVQFTVADTNALSGTVGISNVVWSPGLPDLQLPIVLSAFSAHRADDGMVVIAWATASETENFGFYVQRRRTGEEGYADVPGGFIPGHGTTAEPQAYSFTDASGADGAWWYRLKQVDLDGAVRYSDPVRIDAVTGVAGTVPATSYLAQNYPNPFNPSTTIAFGTSERGMVSLRVYNALGQEVAVLQNGEMEAGVHSVAFDAHAMPSGMYWYVLQAGSFRSTKQLVLVR